MCLEILVALWHTSHKVFGQAPGSFTMLVLDLGCTLEIPTPRPPPDQLNHNLGACDPGTGFFFLKHPGGSSVQPELRAIG